MEQLCDDVKTQGDMPKKLKGVIRGFQIFGILGIGVSVLLILLLIFSSDLSQKVAINVISSIIGAIIFSPILLFTAKGLKGKRKWAKNTAVVVSILVIPGFPVGTVAGISWLIRLFSKDTVQWFATAAVSNP